jgi:hypothetical protein
MICVDVKQSILQSFLLVKGEFYSYFLRTNIIILPDVQFVDFAYDSDMRIIFALAKVPNQENIGKSSTI